MTDELELRLHAALGRPVTADQRSWLDHRVALMLAEPRGPRRSLRITRSTALAVGLSLLLATAFGVWAGPQGTEAPYGMQGAVSYEAERDAAMAVTPIPPGTAWPPYLYRSADRSATYAVGLGRSEVEYNAACLWFGYWVAQQERGTAATRAAALTGVLQMRNWQSFSDPALNSSITYFEGLLRAAERGDAAPIRAELATNCGP